MSDEEQNTENEEAVDQSAVDEMFDEAGGDAAGGDDSFNLDQIDEDSELKKIAEESATKYDIGEPMANDVTAIYDIPVQISAVLGRSTMQVSQLLKLGRGAVVELDRKVGEAIDIYVNNRLVARGEVVVVEDKLGITMTEIVKSDKA